MIKLIYCRKLCSSKWLMTVLTICFISATAYAQVTSTVSGKVTDAGGNVLPGVTVLLKGTNNGTATGTDGNYSLSVSDLNGTLVFSFIGYTTKEVLLNGKTTLNVALTEDAKALEEVVVIGYGTREKGDVTGAISQINAAEITKQVTMSPEMALQGRMPGVFVSNPGSSPTARPQIRIRGVGTLGFNDPLYVIDGIPITEGGSTIAGAVISDLRGPINIFSLINPNDIESMSVLKDASATAIYGVRAANGVVLITTKRGKEGKARVDFSANTGVQNINKRYDVMSVQDYVAITREAWANRNYTPPVAVAPLFDPASPDYLGNNQSYTKDWEDALVRKNALIQDYSVSLSGGNKVSNYSVGLGYADQENVIYNGRFKRYSFSVNSDHKLAPWLTVGETFRLVYGKNDEDNAPGNLGSFVVPWQPFYDPNDPTGYARPGRNIAGTFRSRGYGDGSGDNFRAIGEMNYNERDLKRNLASVYAEVSPLAGLRFRGTYSVDYYTNTREVYNDQRMGLYMQTEGSIRSAAGNTYNIRNNENINLVGEFLIGYNKTFNNHNFDLILNAMDQKVYWNYGLQAIDVASPITSWDQRRIDEGWPIANKNISNNRNISGLQGYMARMSYNFNKKYYLDATVRRDGSSKFGPGYKWGTFPSFAAAYRISSEPFMQGQNIVSNLKIRTGWGRIGNQEVGREFGYLSQVNVNPKAAFGSDGSGNGVVADASGLITIPTTDLQWEVVTTSNVAIESEFLNGKLRFVAEYYNRFTDGILQESPIPASSGFVIRPVINLAQVTNRGFEFDVNFNERIGEFGFNAGVNLTTVRNRISKLYNDIPQGGSENRRQVGYPINYIWGYQTDGIFQTPGEVASYLATTQDPGNMAFKAPGDVRFRDIAGQPAAGSPTSVFNSVGPDGVVNNFDQTYLGKTIAGYYGGLNLGADYKNFDISALFRYVGDVQRVFRLGYESIGGGGGNYLSVYNDRWTAENPSTTIPRAIQSDPSQNNRFSDRFVHDAGFVRLQNLQLGYTLKTGLLERAGVRNFRITATGQNLFVLSSFPDLDPEDITTPTTLMLGLNLGF